MRDVSALPENHEGAQSSQICSSSWQRITDENVVVNFIANDKLKNWCVGKFSVLMMGELQHTSRKFHEGILFASIARGVALIILGGEFIEWCRFGASVFFACKPSEEILQTASILLKNVL